MDEFQILPICDFVLVDGKRRNVNLVSLELVVPSESSIAWKAQRRAALGNRDHLFCHWKC